MQVDGDDAGLAGCKVINNVTVESDPIYEHYQKEAVSHSESAYAQWDGAENAVEGEESFGEALELRMGYYREKLKRDVRIRALSARWMYPDSSHSLFRGMALSVLLQNNRPSASSARRLSPNPRIHIGSFALDAWRPSSSQASTITC